MFSIIEKRLIADAIEQVLLKLKHPEMPKEKPLFKIHIDGKESWSWADIEPNWVFDDKHKLMLFDPWNERDREIAGGDPNLTP